MYVRRDRQKRKSKTATYLSLAHNVTEDSPKGKRTKPVVLANLGEEENLSLEVASAMVGSLDRYIQKRWGQKPKPVQWGEIAEEIKPVASTCVRRQLKMPPTSIKIAGPQSGKTPGPRRSMRPEGWAYEERRGGKVVTQGTEAGALARDRCRPGRDEHSHGA